VQISEGHPFCQISRQKVLNRVIQQRHKDPYKGIARVVGKQSDESIRFQAQTALIVDERLTSIDESQNICPP
jgi:hypothetical protein